MACDSQLSAMLRPDLRSSISSAYLADEDEIAARRIAAARLTPQESRAALELATKLAQQLRAARPAGIDAFMHEYALSSEEGVALMCLAEALLRVPDAETADKLIKDKIGGADWARHKARSSSLFVNASTWALMLTGRVVQLDRAARPDFEGILRSLVARSGEPVIRQAVTYAMRLLGKQFVLGRTIKEALEEAKASIREGYRFSFDMLGEAAYTRRDAVRYARSYADAIAAISSANPANGAPIFARPSISVKLSALHPRYEFAQRERVLRELLPLLIELASAARAGGIVFTIDAEEADRLDLMLDVIETLGGSLPGWNGLGIAVQAYQKRCLPLIDWLKDLAHAQGRRIPLRLVKGAYWDTEIKKGQEAGLADYPVFTRKLGTDVSYLAAARAILAAGETFFPQFATHNAHTIAAIDAIASPSAELEFQRLHGMGEALHAFYRAARPGRIGTRIYAPVGSHEDLLAYLVRRLLENGANTSFVNRLADEESPIEDIVADPVEQLAVARPYRNPKIPKPPDLFPGRRNSRGFLWSDPAVSAPVLAEMQARLGAPLSAFPLVAGEARKRSSHAILDPSDRRRAVGHVSEASDRDAQDALAAAAIAQISWDVRGGDERARILERSADLFERESALLMGLAVREAGKTLPNALSELREAVDFLRYYAQQARGA